MNYGISILFRAIPLLMALFCFGYGAFVLDMGTDVNRFVAGPVVFSLGMICIALFATAATIIRQLIHTYSTAAKYVLPILGYLAAIVCFIGGMTYINDGITAAHFVAGHVICGVAFITACVATTATASTRFTLIPQNSKRTDHTVPAKAFSSAQGDALIILAVIFAVITWVWTFWLLGQSSTHVAYFVAGHVMAGTLSILWGLWILTDIDPDKSSIGYIMIGLGLVCYSISSKVILLAVIWRNVFKLANRIPLIPVLTALTCLFLSAFMFEMATLDDVYFVPARVLAGLGGICFTLFSIVSILESGTSNS